MECNNRESADTEKVRRKEAYFFGRRRVSMITATQQMSIFQQPAKTPDKYEHKKKLTVLSLSSYNHS